MHRMSILFIAAMFLGPTASAQDWAKARLNDSPRHLEWVKIKHGNREVNCFIAYPEVKDKATAVVVIHEIFGLTDWVRGVTDQLAEAGYIAIAPICSRAVPQRAAARKNWAGPMPCEGSSRHCRRTRSRPI